MALAKHMSTSHSHLQKSVSQQCHGRIWQSFFLQTSVLTQSNRFLTLEFSTKRSAKDACLKHLQSRHAKMVGFVESRLISFV